ncbi:MAG: sensor histidine kinase [Oscillospiraceae bacterium]
MVKRAKHFIYNRLSIQQKIWLVILLVICVVAMGATVGSIHVVEAYNAQLYTKTAEIMAYSSEKIGVQLKTITDLSKYIMTDKQLQANVESLQQAATNVERSLLTNSISSKINDFYIFNNEIISISILNETQDITLGLDSSPESAATRKEIYRAVREANGEAVWLQSDLNAGSFLCARLIRKIDNMDLRELGVLVIRVDIRHVVKNAEVDKAANGYDREVFLVNEGQVVYSNVQGPEEYLPALEEGERQFDIVEIGGQRFFVVSRLVQPVGLQYFELVPYEQIFRSILQTASYILYALVVASLLALLVSNAIVRQITRRIATLNLKMKGYQTGSMPAPVPIAAPGAEDSGQKDEINLLHRRFSLMVLEHDKLTQDNMQKMLLLKEHRIRELEQQINPHFFYNALESINWYAKIANQSEISQITEGLGRLLRITLTEKDDVIAVDKEVLMVKSYIGIQTIQYGERLVFTQTVDPAAGQCLIPKMSIQPLVENAIVHGLEEMPGVCKIELQVWTDQYLHVCVRNSDTVIDEHLLEYEGPEATSKGFGIGIRNIDSRIKLIYGEKYGLALKNNGNSVEVSFCIPKIRREGEEIC